MAEKIGGSVLPIHTSDKHTDRDESKRWLQHMNVVYQQSTNGVIEFAGTFFGYEFLTGVSANVRIQDIIYKYLTGFTSLKVYVYWFPGDVGAGNVRHSIFYRTVAEGEAVLGGQSGTQAITTAVPGAVQLMRTVFDLSALTIAESDLFFLTYMRRGNDALDTYGGSVVVIGWEIVAEYDQ